MFPAFFYGASPAVERHPHVKALDRNRPKSPDSVSDVAARMVAPAAYLSEPGEIPPCGARADRR
jgi:hypothetical protein